MKLEENNLRNDEKSSVCEYTIFQLWFILTFREELETKMELESKTERMREKEQLENLKQKEIQLHSICIRMDSAYWKDLW